MMTLATTRAVTLGITLAVLAPLASAAPEPTLSDIAGCNEQAASRTGASALPHSGWRTPDASANPSMSPSADATKPGIIPGPADRGVGAAPRPATDTPTSGRSGPAEKTDPSGEVISQTPDPLVQGMDAGKADDPQYRAAYRDCMRSRLEGR